MPENTNKTKKKKKQKKKKKKKTGVKFDLTKYLLIEKYCSNNEA